MENADFADQLMGGRGVKVNNADVIFLVYLLLQNAYELHHF